MTTTSTIPCFALLDDAQSLEAQSRLYTKLEAILICKEIDDWGSFLLQTQNALNKGLYAVALLSYETGAQLQGIKNRNELNRLPVGSKVLIFKQCQFLSQHQVQSFLNLHSKNQQAGITNLHPNISQADFNDAIEKILAYIKAGDTYQVNYTYRLHFQVYGSPIHLYQSLRERQPVPYGALICLPDGEAVLSLSPELFIRHQQGQLFAKPMKGTAAATGNALEDEQIALALSQDQKNRAENLMIVDLLRNDLGRIAKIGTVKVTKLFDVHRFSSVLQMTSDIEAQLRDDVNLTEALNALFPCGSITGAPKRRTMEIIREIETEDRGIYTGAIGWFDPPSAQQTLGDFCLSVPIRTLVLSTPDNESFRQGVMGVGAGIVHDSVADEEFSECNLKAKFLTGMPAPFHLFETMFANRNDSCRHLTLHLQRLKNSAKLFSFPFDEEAIRQKINASCNEFQDNKNYRVRLALFATGEIQIQFGELAPIAQVQTILISQEQCTTSDLLLAHKTSFREQYDQAWQAAEKIGAFDLIFVNQEGFVTEGGRCNIFVRYENEWFTPPLQAGVLPGIMRSLILQDPAWNANEKNIKQETLMQADEIMICNALRGTMKARII
jgi:para-aminobenzoate synthetase/4-amino-4-deoxychorismate lyase